MMENSLKALIVGATGNTGRELLKELLKSKQWSEVHVIVRKEPESWKDLSEEHKNKLKVIKVEGLEAMQDETKFPNLRGISSVFCTLGAEMEPKDNFVKVDKTYPLLAADLAKKNNIPQYHIVTCISADKSSRFFTLRVKGEVEYELSQKGFQYLGCYRPGLILQREQPRFLETVCQYIPFIKKINTRDIALAMKIQAEKAYAIQENKIEYFENDNLIKIAKQNQ